MEGAIFLKKLCLLIICLALVFCSCGKNPGRNSDFYEPFSDSFVYSEKFPSSDPDGIYLFFPDFAVDFPAGWYKERGWISCQFTRSAGDVAVDETVSIKSAKSAFRKTDREYRNAVFSEEMTFGGYPAKKYVVENPKGFDHYRKYIYKYYIAMDEKLIHLSFFPESTESLKNQREYFEKSLDSIVKMNTSFPESLYDMDIENFLSGKNDDYLMFLFDCIICAFVESDSEGFSDFSELSSETLLNVYFYAADNHSAMYEEEKGNYLIPTKDIRAVLDKYFGEYEINLESGLFGTKLSEDGKTLLSPTFIANGFVPWGGRELDSVIDNGDGTLLVKYVTYSIDEEAGPFSKTGKIEAEYSATIRPGENKCIIEKLEIKYYR